MEYLEEFGFEMLQADELSRWWAASSLPLPGSCDVVVSFHATPLASFPACVCAVAEVLNFSATPLPSFLAYVCIGEELVSPHATQNISILFSLFKWL